MRIRNIQTGKFADRTHPIKWSENGFNFDDVDKARTFHKDSILRWLQIEADHFQTKMCKQSWIFLADLFNTMEFVDNNGSAIPAVDYLKMAFPKWF